MQGCRGIVAAKSFRNVVEAHVPALIRIRPRQVDGKVLQPMIPSESVEAYVYQARILASSTVGDHGRAAGSGSAAPGSERDTPGRAGCFDLRSVDVITGDPETD